jgi:hypothetical protein
MTKKKTQTKIYHQKGTRILMESPLLEETGTQPQDTMQEDNNTTEKECIHNGKMKKGRQRGRVIRSRTTTKKTRRKSTGKGQGQNKDKEKQKIMIPIDFNIGTGE